MSIDTSTLVGSNTLDALARILWRAHRGETINDTETDELSLLIGVRKILAGRGPGSRPRSPKRLARRRRIVAAGWLPPKIAQHYTYAEQADLAVAAMECAANGRCDLSVGDKAALAGRPQRQTESRPPRPYQL